MRGDRQQTFHGLDLFGNKMVHQVSHLVSRHGAPPRIVDIEVRVGGLTGRLHMADDRLQRGPFNFNLTSPPLFDTNEGRFQFRVCVAPVGSLLFQGGQFSFHLIELSLQALCVPAGQGRSGELSHHKAQYQQEG